MLLPLFFGFLNQADERVAIKTFDVEILKQLIFDKVNETRVKKGVKALVIDDKLDELCLKYNNGFEGRNFKNTSSIERKIERTLFAKAKRKGFKGGLIMPIVGDAHAMDFNEKGEFFLDKLQTDSEFMLFAGKKPKKSDVDYQYREIESLTYAQFADRILRELTSENRKQLYSKAFKWTGFHLQWYYKSLYKRRLPRVKMICIVGGYQTAGMR